MKLHTMALSANCYKVELLARFLDRPLELAEIDVLGGETRRAPFLAMNPTGRVPVLELEPGRFLSESGAILHYLAEGTPFLPEEPLERARVMQWMFFEQNSHEPCIATVRFWVSILKDEAVYRDRLDRKRKQGYAALDVMERHLTERAFFVGERCTIADIMLYGYTHVAHHGGFEMARYPAIRAWIERIAGLPGYAPMRAEPTI